MAKYNVFLKDIATGEEIKVEEITAKNQKDAKQQTTHYLIENLGKKQVRIVRK